jgi:hypothetical protein
MYLEELKMYYAVGSLKTLMWTIEISFDVKGHILFVVSLIQKGCCQSSFLFSIISKSNTLVKHSAQLSNMILVADAN